MGQTIALCLAERRHDLLWRMFATLALLLIGKLVTVAVPYAFKWATDGLAGHPTAHHLFGFVAGPLALTLLYGLLRIAMAGFTQARDAVFAAVAMNAVRRLANDVFVHLHLLSLRFHLERRIGGLTRILERGRNAIETIVRTVVLVAAPTAVEFLLILAVFLVQFDWRYTLAVATMIAAYMVFTFTATNWRINIRRTMNESDVDANTKALDSLLNYETVKYFGAEAREAARYDRSMARYEQTSVKSYTSLTFLNFGQALIFSVGLTVVMAMSIAGIRGGHNSVGDFVLINAMMIQLYQPLNFLGSIYRDIRQATIDLEMMFDILGKHPEIADRPGAKPLAVAGGHCASTMSIFSYDPDREILKGISFDVPPGQTLAIVGPSGAGKSTISRLIFRFYEPSSGTITIDGQNIDAVTQQSLRAAIGMVPQDTVLFNDTIGYNIRYGRAEATDVEVKEAARLAQIDRFVESVPGGYEAQVGERGLKLSGGEKQRVAIARDNPQIAADPRSRRGDLGPRQFHRRRNPGCARPGRQGPYHARHRAPALDCRQCGRDSRARPGADRRARRACGAPGPQWRLCRDVEPAERSAPGRGGLAPRRGRRAGCAAHGADGPSDRSLSRVLRRR